MKKIVSVLIVLLTVINVAQAEKSAPPAAAVAPIEAPQSATAQDEKGIQQAANVERHHPAPESEFGKNIPRSKDLNKKPVDTGVAPTVQS